jgi:hypothetical protein
MTSAEEQESQITYVEPSTLAEIRSFDYKGYPARVGVDVVDGRWFVSVSMYHWINEMQRHGEQSFSSRDFAFEKGAALIRHLIDRDAWQSDFRDKWDDLVFGCSEWEYELPEHNWANIEWLKRGGRSGDETAVLRFNEMSADEKAEYLPGGRAYKADWITIFDRPSSGPVPEN